MRLKVWLADFKSSGRFIWFLSSLITMTGGGIRRIIRIGIIRSLSSFHPRQFIYQGLAFLFALPLGSFRRFRLHRQSTAVSVLPPSCRLKPLLAGLQLSMPVCPPASRLSWWRGRHRWAHTDDEVRVSGSRHITSRCQRTDYFLCHGDPARYPISRLNLIIGVNQSGSYK